MLEFSIKCEWLSIYLATTCVFNVGTQFMVVFLYFHLIGYTVAPSFHFIVLRFVYSMYRLKILSSRKTINANINKSSSVDLLRIKIDYLSSVNANLFQLNCFHIQRVAFSFKETYCGNFIRCSTLYSKVSFIFFLNYVIWTPLANTNEYMNKVTVNALIGQINLINEGSEQLLFTIDSPTTYTYMILFALNVAAI